jgi:hypothetical protein
MSLAHAFHQCEDIWWPYLELALQAHIPDAHVIPGWHAVLMSATELGAAIEALSVEEAS